MYMLHQCIITLSSQIEDSGFDMPPQDPLQSFLSMLKTFNIQGEEVILKQTSRPLKVQPYT